MKYYLDTSFLFSLYASDANSARADVWRQANPRPLLITPLHRLELRNAIWLGVFRRHCSVNDAQQYWREIEADLSTGLLISQSISSETMWREAESLVEPHTRATGARSLDILHVAYAKALGVDEFITFDQRQSALALRIGLKVAVI